MPKLIYSDAPPEYENGDEISQNDDLTVLVGVVLLEYPYKNQILNNKYFNGILRYTTSTTKTCQTVRSLTSQNEYVSFYYGIMFNVQAFRSLTLQTLDTHFIEIEDKFDDRLEKDLNFTV